MALQAVLRDIDSGKLGRFIKIGMIAVILAGLCVLYFLYQFKGLGTEQAMDQAQIARSLVSGEGFSTRYIRPLAISQLKGAEKEVPSGGFPDFTHAPLHPLLEAAALFPVKKRLTMDVSEMIGTGDRAIAFLGIFLLLASVLVWYLAGLRLFDRIVALLAAGLLLVTDLMWQYAISGLPQQLLILLLTGVGAHVAHPWGHRFPAPRIPSLLLLRLQITGSGHPDPVGRLPALRLSVVVP
jgi:hypothetical protein